MTMYIQNPCLRWDRARGGADLQGCISRASSFCATARLSPKVQKPKPRPWTPSEVFTRLRFHIVSLSTSCFAVLDPNSTPHKTEQAVSALRELLCYFFLSSLWTRSALCSFFAFTTWFWRDCEWYMRPRPSFPEPTNVRFSTFELSHGTKWQGCANRIVSARKSCDEASGVSHQLYSDRPHQQSKKGPESSQLCMWKKLHARSPFKTPPKLS